MISLGAQRSDWPYKSHVVPSHVHSEFTTVQPVKTRPKYQALTKRVLSVEDPQGRFISSRLESSLELEFRSKTTYDFGERNCRPRHVPIVISQSVIESVLKSLPGPPRSQKSERKHESPPIFQEDTFRLGSSSIPTSRPRHIPIVIPTFAQPHGVLLPSPLPNHRATPKAPPTTPYSCKFLFTTMSRPTTSGSRTSNQDSTIFAPSPNQTYPRQSKPGSSAYAADMNSSQTSLSQSVHHGQENPDFLMRLARAGEVTTSSGATSPPTGQQSHSTGGTTNLSGLVCNVHKCTGREPHALVGATTTILGDKLFVFGGRVLSRRRPPLTSDLYELDLIRRHWTKVETFGDVPPPRYFHSVCALGDTKLICYGGMSPASSPSAQAQGSTVQQQAGAMESQPEVVVLSDIHIYDAPSRTWTYVPTSNTPQGRYAHCAAVLPSAATFTSANAPLSAIHHNPSSANPNQGSIGVDLDGTGGAEMVIVGGQDSANHYIEQVSVFNLRSLKWTATHTLGRSCGAYRSVVAPLTNLPAVRIGKGSEQEEDSEESAAKAEKSHADSSMLIYSNYNFLDVKLELQVRLSDGSMAEKPMNGQFSPPGLRFPNGGVLDNHFVVSGTYLTSSKQEYALWALDLETLIWSRIDAGGNIFSQGSWNRGILWSRRNVFVILGNRKRSLVEDYNHRRINFSNVCMVELEAFGLYDNPRLISPTSSYPSISAPVIPRFHSHLSHKSSGAAGQPLSNAAIELGQMAMNSRELADMDFVAIGGERVPVNSYLVARRWGPYFVQLLRESASSSLSNPHVQNDSSSSKSESCTLRPAGATQSVTSRNSSITITPGVSNTNSTGASSLSAPSNNTNTPVTTSLDPPSAISLAPSSRPRALYLPHTVLTIRALVHYFYTASLPPQNHPLCTPQILCSLLQISRPYRVDGLLEAVVERLHEVLDGRNAAAVFNAAAMAAGGGRGTGTLFGREDETFRFEEEEELEEEANEQIRAGAMRNSGGSHQRPTPRPGADSRDESESEDEDARSELSGSTMSSVADSELIGSSADGTQDGVEEGDEVWGGGVSCVVGLQKRGLRGLMEGRRMRERGKSGAVNGVGLGIA